MLAFGGGPGRGRAEMREGEAAAFGGKSPEDQCGLLINVCPQQGSGAIATEDAVLLAIGYLRPAILEYGGNVRAVSAADQQLDSMN